MRSGNFRAYSELQRSVAEGASCQEKAYLPRRLQNYKKVLKPDGFYEFKTDNEGLFAFTLEEIEACGYEMIEMSRDLHGEAQGVHGEKSRCFMTEYEEKFSGQGKNINFVRF